MILLALSLSLFFCQSNVIWKRVIEREIYEIKKKYFPQAHLSWQYDESDANHYDHVELGRPDVRDKIPVSHRRKRYDDVIRALKQIHMSVAGSLEMLNSANAVKNEEWTVKFMCTYFLTREFYVSYRRNIFEKEGINCKILSQALQLLKTFLEICNYLRFCETFFYICICIWYANRPVYVNLE